MFKIYLLKPFLIFTLFVFLFQFNAYARPPCVEISGFPTMNSGISNGWTGIFVDSYKEYYNSAGNYSNLIVTGLGKCEPNPHLIIKLELWEEMYYPDSMVVISATIIVASAFRKELEMRYPLDSAIHVIVNNNKVNGTTGNTNNFSFKTNKDSLRAIFFKILRDLDAYKDLSWYMPFCKKSSPSSPPKPVLGNCP